ncbi:GGDEF domain-containing protein [Salinicola corii]|uniref:diguanylate cyclase n=1 Tax=Salinicola corii TaxID=2606937 RepID=A0A640WIK4_9GAMM|nr:GGDEF domain-containing protein [Salinicola corii]KAA0020459.1 GGDEF domain-containing protein [Salinicola corii]
MRSQFFSLWRKGTEAPDSLPAERRRSFEIMAEIYLLALCVQLMLAPVLFLVGRPILGWLNLICLAGYVVALVLHRRLFVATALAVKLCVFLVFVVVVGVVITANQASLVYFLLFAEVEMMLADLRRRTKIVATGCLVTLSLGVLHLPPLHGVTQSVSGVDTFLADLGLGLVFVMLCIVILRMLAITDHHEHRYRRDAMHDSLTRVLNRRAIFERASIYWKANREFAVALVDADRFKEINDNHGHSAGDAVLRHLAGLLRESLRSDDSVGRVGGEEFLMLLPGAGKSQGIAAAMRIRDRLARYPCRLDSIELSVTLSMGIATSEEGLHLRDLIELADRRLYAAKSAGRDQVVAEGHADAATSRNSQRLAQGVERALEADRG